MTSTPEVVGPHERPEITSPAFILILGPSGSGKSSILEKVIKLDPRLVPNPVYTNRPPRKNDPGRISLTPEEFDRKEKDGDFLLVNNIFENKLAILREDIEQVFASGSIPIQDFPLDIVEQYRGVLEPMHTIYVVPPSLFTLKQRLDVDKRDPGGQRYEAGKAELLGLVRKHFQDPSIDDVVINKDVEQAANQVLQAIYRRVCR